MSPLPANCHALDLPTNVLEPGVVEGGKLVTSVRRALGVHANRNPSVQGAVSPVAFGRVQRHIAPVFASRGCAGKESSADESPPSTGRPEPQGMADLMFCTRDEVLKHLLWSRAGREGRRGGQ